MALNTTNTASRHVQSLLRDILETAYCTNLSLTHGAAALNSLCGLLEQCHVSSIPQIRALPYGGETWSRAFNIYLTRSENNKPKPLRRLLLVVTNLLLSHPAESEKILFIGRAVCTATQAIRRENVLGAIKPAIQALEHFLCRGVVDPLQIALVHEPHEITSFRVGASEKERAASRFTLAQISHSVQDFTLRVLEWVKYPDCAPAIGRFLSAFYKRFQAENDNSDDAFMEKRAMPVWIFPVKQSLEQNHEFLEAFETHILPSLLRLDSAGTKSFLDILPFDEIQRGNVGTVENVDIHLCVLVARIETELSAISTADHGKSNAINVEILGMSLLDHANPNVRIAALSLLVASQASAKPFSRKVLESFRQCIPMFHVEVNAKPRNEFIALAKKLCRRLLVATMSLSRSRRSLEKTGHKSNDCPGNNGTVEKTEQNFTRELLEKHLRFRNWYTWFLLSELRPTASYQSHITALKVLHSSLEEYVAARDTLSNGHVDYIEALNLHLPNGVVLRLFSDLLTDPFDDVRQFAYSILKIWLKTMSFPLLRSTEEMSDEAHEQKHVEQTLITSALMHRDLCDAEMIAEETGRADQADGVGRFYSLLYESSRAIAKPTQWHHSHSMILDRLLSTTEKEISIATHDLLKVVSSTALLGHLIALRYIYLWTFAISAAKEHIVDI